MPGRSAPRLRPGDRAAALQAEHAGHRPERDLAEAADRGLAQGALELQHLVAPLVVQPPAGPPDIASVSIACALVEPTRHGTHLPHDSSRKNRSVFVAAASRSVPSAITTTAPEPSIEPAAASVSKSSAASRSSGPRKFEDAPPGCTAASGCPPATPPARSSRARTVVPIGTQ